MRRLWIVLAAAVLSSCATGIAPREVARAYYDLGNAYVQLGDQSKATAAYARALELDASLFEASYNLARVYIETAQYQRATDLLKSLLEKDPKNTITLDTLGYDYYKQGNYETAMSYYRRTLALAPQDPNALFNVAVLLEKQGSYQDALDAFNRLYDVGHDFAVLSHIGFLQVRLGNVKRAIDSFEAYRHYKPDDVDVLVALGDAYRQEQQYDRAIEAYDDALAAKPKSPEVLFHKAYILLTAIQDESAGMEALRAAVAAGFNDAKQGSELAHDPNLIDPDKVTAYLRDQKLLSAAAKTSEPPAAPPSSPSAVPPSTAGTAPPSAVSATP